MHAAARRNMAEVKHVVALLSVWQPVTAALLADRRPGGRFVVA